MASKSGTTAEPRAFEEYFYHLVQQAKGKRAGEKFVAITDPQTPLAELGQQKHYRRVFVNFPDIGGRYSALSYFGLLPAALMGLDVKQLLSRAQGMIHACQRCTPLTENPGINLGMTLGHWARHGRDKVTLVVPPRIDTFGLWLEQLLAESTGKNETGLIPVAQEPLGTDSDYGDDRIFVVLRLGNDNDAETEQKVEALRAAGHPLVTIQLDDVLDLGQEFFRWELATAVAGRLLGINPFNQPNVQESKDNTNQLLARLEKEGDLPHDEPTIGENSLQIYDAPAGGSLSESLQQFFQQARPGDYVALLAYLHEDDATEAALQTIRTHLRNTLKLATTLGYGPRYLHSTGQLHKGGPNTGLYLQLTGGEDKNDDQQRDDRIPGRPYRFGQMQQAQAAGDLQALHTHSRRVIRVHLGNDVQDGLTELGKVVRKATRPEVVASRGD